MKKSIVSVIIFLMVSIIVIGASAVLESGFTHPELGEFLAIKFENHMPYFTIYDFTYYEIVDPTVPYRNMMVNQIDVVNNKMVKLDASLNYFFDSIEQPAENAVPAMLSYGGVSADYSFALEQLPREERIKALKLLNGFEGVKGYKKLLKIPGFEYADIETLEQEHVDFTVKVGKTKYPYRVMMFHFSEGDWVEYNERYCYLKVKGDWKLARITKEYTDDYSARGKYTHGMTGSLLESIEEINLEAMRGAAWGMKIAEIEALEGIQAGEEGVVIEDTTLYRLPATLEYFMKGGKLSEVRYTLKSDQAYFSAFISLYTRYADPITIDEEGNMTWSLNDMTIELTYHNETPAIVFAPYK